MKKLQLHFRHGKKCLTEVVRSQILPSQTLPKQEANMRLASQVEFTGSKQPSAFTL